jgi:hypothetical protein
MVRQRRAAIEGGDLRVVPPLDIAKINVHQRRPVELEVTVEARQVVGQHDRPGDGGNLDDVLRAAGLFHFFLAHGRIGAGEVEGLVRDALDAAARPDRLVIDLHSRMRLGVLRKPAVVDRVRECGSRGIDILSDASASGRHNRYCCQYFQLHSSLPQDLLWSGSAHLDFRYVGSRHVQCPARVLRERYIRMNEPINH